MQRRIILTGSNGLLGQKLVYLLADRPQIKLIATSRGINRHSLRGGYHYEPLDLLDTEGWRRIFQEVGPTDLIHTAAMTLVDQCETDHETCDKYNVEAVAFLASLCKEYGTRFIHISTDFIFDGEAGPYTERAEPRPLNYYGGAKLKAEEIVQNSGVDWAILRTMLLYGVTPAMSRSNIVLWAKKSLEENKEIKVVSDQWRCPTLAEDLAAGTLAAVMKDARGIFHLSGGEMMSISELVHQVADHWKLDKSLITEIESSSLNQAAKRPPKTGFIILKAQTELRYQPHSLTQGLALVDKQLREGWTE
ncbi:MAG: SDR family oxidoreductase [Bacteroidia bacterium]|nr:SDR family oxidoreductase [Bacteroidia bacterium]